MVRGHETVGCLSYNFFLCFKQQWSGVTWPSADCQTTFYERFKKFRKFWKKVTEWSRDSGWRSRDRRPTVKQRFFDVSSHYKNFVKKSLNSHATLVGGHATFIRLLNNVFLTFQAIWKHFEKITERSRDSGRRSHNRRPTVKPRLSTFQAIWEHFEKIRWTVMRQWLEVTRPSADCQTTFLFLNVFQAIRKFLKKFSERSRDSGWRSRDRRSTVGHH